MIKINCDLLIYNQNEINFVYISEYIRQMNAMINKMLSELKEIINSLVSHILQVNKIVVRELLTLYLSQIRFSLSNFNTKSFQSSPTIYQIAKDNAKYNLHKYLNSFVVRELPSKEEIYKSIILAIITAIVLKIFCL